MNINEIKKQAEMLCKITGDWSQQVSEIERDTALNLLQNLYAEIKWGSSQPQQPSRQEDKLFNEALRYALTRRQLSASHLQRRLSIGFNRACRLLDQLEKAGIVGPGEGNQTRKVLQTAAEDDAAADSTVQEPQPVQYDAQAPVQAPVPAQQAPQPEPAPQQYEPVNPVQTVQEEPQPVQYDAQAPVQAPVPAQ